MHETAWLGSCKLQRTRHRYAGQGRCRFTLPHSCPHHPCCVGCMRSLQAHFQQLPAQEDLVAAPSGAACRVVRQGGGAWFGQDGSWRLQLGMVITGRGGKSCPSCWLGMQEEAGTRAPACLLLIDWLLIYRCLCICTCAGCTRLTSTATLTSHSSSAFTVSGSAWAIAV